ncbi:MAG: phosphate ABC transporter substrate-binding protein PstS [Mycobacterium sp.]|nr:phosphate ABC transporter substrate-binding protein PstS [Mycobacterium sp.]
MRVDRVCRAFAAATLAGLALAGCGSDNNISGASLPSGSGTGRVNCGGENELTAEGSTAQQNAMALFNQAWGRLCPGKRVSYNPTGSGAGRQQFVDGHVDFAGADTPLAARQIDPAVQRCGGNPPWHLPLVFGPIALAYHLQGVDSLIVNGDMLAKIFSGVITRWNDPAIAALNPGVPLPGSKITPIYRSDSSGTTDNFQRYLTAAAPQSWAKGVGTEFQGGVGEGAQKSAGVVQAVRSTPGAIGYVEKGFADEAGVPYARIDSGSGAVPLTEATARKAIDNATFAGKGNDLVLDLDAMYATNAPGVYPLVLATYEIVCSKGYDRGTSAAVVSFLTAAANNGQAGLAQAGYIPLPDKFKERLLTAISAIR